MTHDLFDITIIGAGVVGLAIAEELSAKYHNILLVEKNISFGQETSSRHSEVIHAGIYYPAGSLKAIFCRDGNHLLYETCKERAIPHKRLGKLIVATDDGEIGRLWNIKEMAEQNNVDNLSFLTKKQLRSLEPEVRAELALLSPSTGIIDSHSLVRSFYINAKLNDAIIAFHSKVTDIQYDGNHYELQLNDGEYHFRTKVLINSAGLYSDKVAEIVGIDIDKKGYRFKYCKGNYFSVSPSPDLRHLVYPTPPNNNEGLGIHATIDLNHRVRFGPDTEYVQDIEYSVDNSRKKMFYQSINKYLPGVKIESLSPEMSGIRPKLQGSGEPYKDFVIKEESDTGYFGLINLIGIESPGLTACIPISRHVSSLVQSCL